MVKMAGEFGAFLDLRYPPKEKAMYDETFSGEKSNYDGVPEPKPMGAAEAALAVEAAQADRVAEPRTSAVYDPPFKPSEVQAACAVEAALDKASTPASTKVPLHLFPPVAMIHTVRVLEAGALKHGGTFNWRDEGGKIPRAEYLGKAMRHILAALDGEDLDPEDGRPHEAHAIADLAIIMDAMQAGTCIEDRNPSYCVPALLKQEAPE